MRRSGAGVCATGNGLPSDPSYRRRQICREHSHTDIRPDMSPSTCAATGVFHRVAAMPVMIEQYCGARRTVLEPAVLASLDGGWWLYAFLKMAGR